MIFKILLDLNKKQSIEFNKLGLATKFIIKEVSSLIYENYKRNLKLTSSLILEQLSSSNFKEVTSYNIKIFKPVIKMLLTKFNKLEKKDLILNYKYETKKSYKIFFDEYSLNIQSDVAVLEKSGYLPNISSNANYFLKFKHTYPFLIKRKLSNISLIYDGYNYYLEGSVITNYHRRRYGISVLFGNSNFLETSNGVKISKLSDDPGFYNKCLIVIELEKKLKNSEKNLIFDAELNSLNFTKNYLIKTIKTYIKECVKMIIDFNPSSIVCKVSKASSSNLKDKINNYIVRLTKEVILRESKKKHIDFIDVDLNEDKIDKSNISSKI